MVLTPNQEIDMGDAPENPAQEARQSQRYKFDNDRFAPDGREVVPVAVAEWRQGC